MGFKNYVEDKELEDELKKLKDEKHSIPDEDKITDEEKVSLDIDGDNDVDSDDIDDLLDKELEDDEELEEAVKDKKEILKDRFKKASRKLILDKLSGGKGVTPVLLAQFKTNYEFDSSVGRFGKWRIRKNKSDFKKNNPMAKVVKGIKMKAKRMRKLLKKGSIKRKQEIGKRKTAVRMGGKTVDAKGSIVKK